MLVLYGGAGEYHELAVESLDAGKVLEGPKLDIDDKDGYTIVGWNVTENRSVLQLGDLHIYLLGTHSLFRCAIKANSTF